jgi:hypothetical protein
LHPKAARKKLLYAPTRESGADPCHRRSERQDVHPGLSDKHRARFRHLVAQRTIPRVGHNLPAEVSQVVAEAVLSLLRISPTSARG